MHHEVSLLSFTGRGSSNVNVAHLQTICQDVQTVKWNEFVPKSRRARVGYFNPDPRSLVDTYSPEMAQAVQKTLAIEHFDLIVSSQIQMTIYSKHFEKTPALLEELEIGVFHDRVADADSLRNNLRNRLTLFKLRRYLQRVLPRFEACTVVSEREKQLLSKYAPDYHAVDIIPNCVDLSKYHIGIIAATPDTLVFTGSLSYAANYEAMVWFLRFVYPEVKREAPTVRLIITGDHGNRPLPPASDVTLTGVVDDIREYIASSWISLAPIWSGGGTRLKILDAMALHTPVVATSKGAEGLEVKCGKEIILADTAETYATALIRLLGDADLRRRLAENAHKLVKEKYDWEVVLPRFLQLIERTGNMVR